MESQVVKLKSEFNNLINMRNTVKNIFDILQSRIDKLKLLYAEFIHNNKNQVFVFGLDSFHFQSKLINIEYDDMKRLFLAINNRMYCEYFKLNKIIIEYIFTNINDKKITEIITVNNFPIYKDLEPFKEYKFETLMDIHENILKMINVLISELNSKENELSIHKTKQNIGLNIDNFVTTFNYNNNVMKERITMFTTYIEFFHKLHTKYLKRFSNKIQLLYKDINNDIKFDEAIEVNKKANSITSEYSDFSSDSDSELNEMIRKISVSELSDNNNTNKLNTEDNNEIANYNENSNYNIDSSNFNENIHKSILNDNVDELFLNIEPSCDSIINSKTDVSEIEVKINELDTSNNDINIIEKTLEETNIEETNMNDEVESTTTSNDTVSGEPKKKRTYKPRKKKS